MFRRGRFLSFPLVIGAVIIGVVSGKAIFGPPLEEYWTKKLQEEAAKKGDAGTIWRTRCTNLSRHQTSRPHEDMHAQGEAYCDDDHRLATDVSHHFQTLYGQLFSCRIYSSFRTITCLPQHEIEKRPDSLKGYPPCDIKNEPPVGWYSQFGRYLIHPPTTILLLLIEFLYSRKIFCSDLRRDRIGAYHLVGSLDKGFDCSVAH
ncbi:hypothetical protein C4D60_Mb08t02560 [Musa balbisiana]|uniref:Uncharacterized protein n=1 Tax=Musa balbisiana TaxID=52838 RepID=A0A4S8K0W1_MUSBA|nr:hypothetical protein C4D60_Mb08t02560 [Musa balbisiana]